MRRLLFVLALVLLAACDYRIVDERGITPTPIPIPTPTPAPTPPPVPIPMINVFIAEPARVFLLGGRISLRWDVSLPTGTPLSTPMLVRIDPQPGTVPALGSTIVQPFERGVQTFFLTAETTGGRASRVVQVVVD